jgi:periplasmic protein TonB
MVIQPASAPALVHAIPGADPDRRRLSRTAAFAVAVSVAAHVAVGLYIYEAKYGAPPALAPADPPIVTTFAPDVTVRPKPTKAPPPPPHQLIVRPSPTPPIATQPTAPFTPVIARPLDLSQPPVLASNVIIPPAPPQPAPPSVITSPDWLTRPGADEFSRFYPQAALDRNASGAATLACTVSASGAVRGCQVAEETPKGLGFGDAARKLVPYFKLRPQLRDGTPVDGASVRIPIRFNLAP